MSDSRKLSNLIIAGPGTGKTTTLIREISDLIMSTGLDHGLIICTFTRKAAEEIRTRLFRETEINLIANRPFLIGTIHSICLEILKLHSSGKYSDLEIIPEDEMPSYINAKLAKFGFNRELYKGGGKIWDLCSDIVSIFSLITDQQLSFETFDYTKHPEIEEIVSNYNLYKKMLQHDNKIDFAMIQTVLLEQLKTDPEFKALIGNTFAHVFVDEYQDTNTLQHQLFMELCSPKTSITVVGDDDQSIYSFRGADVANLLNFPESISKNGLTLNTKFLMDNFRSTNRLVTFSKAFIDNTVSQRYVKDFSAARNIEGVFPVIGEFSSPMEEANWIAETIVKLKTSGKINTFSEVSVLFRSAKFQSEYVKISLRENNIPYKQIGTGDFFEQEFVQEFLHILDFLLNRDDDALDVLEAALNQTNPDTCQLILKSDIITKLIDLKDDFSNYGSCIGLLYDLFSATDFLERYKHEGINLGTLTSLVLNYDENVKAFDPFWMRSYLRYLQRKKVVDYEDQGADDAVQIMTIHRAKGLEFSCVFMPFQNKLSASSDRVEIFRAIAGISRDDVDDESRLFYVGITRAKNFLGISRSKSNKANGPEREPSETFMIAQQLSNVSLSELDSAFDKLPQANNLDLEKVINATLSYNTIKTYQICPRQYMYRHDWRLQTVRTGGMQFGSNMHKLLQVFNALVQEKPIPDIEVANLIETYWKNNWFQNNATNAAFKSVALNQLLKWKQFLAENIAEWRVLQIEDGFNVSVEKEVIVGRFDLVLDYRGEKIIVDFKTGEKRDYTSQLSFYGFCYQKKFGGEKPSLNVFYLKSGEWESVKPVSDQEVLDSIINTAKDIRDRKFDAKPGPHCSDCAFNNICSYSTKS